MAVDHKGRHYVCSADKKEQEMFERGLLMITWPFSQKIMEHPLCIFEYDCDTYGSAAYWVPKDIWEQYKGDGKYYEPDAQV